MSQNTELLKFQHSGHATEGKRENGWQTDNLYPVSVNSAEFQLFLRQVKSGSGEFDLRGYFPKVKRLAQAAHYLEKLCFKHPLRYSFMLEAVTSRVSTIVTVWDSEHAIGCAVVLPALHPRYSNRLGMYRPRLDHFSIEELVKTAYLEEIMVHPDYRGKGVLIELLRNLSLALYQAGYIYLHGDFIEIPRQMIMIKRDGFPPQIESRLSMVDLLKVHYPHAIEIGVEIPGLTPLSNEQIFMVMNVEKLKNSFYTDLV